MTTLYHRDAAAAGIRADGAQAVTAARNNEVRLWDVASGLELTRLTADQLPRALALSPDGRWLATLSGDRDIGLYALRPDDLIAQACRWLDAPCP